MIIIVHLFKDGFIPDVRLPLVLHPTLLLALVKLLLIDVHLEAVQKILKDDKLDHTTPDIIDLLKSLQNFSLLAIEIV